MLTWELPIAIDLWIAGIGGGAYFAAFLMDRITRGRYELLPKIAMLLSVPLVLLGSLTLVLDLGEQLRAWHLFTRFRPESAMSMGSWTLLLYAIIGIVMIALWWSESFEPDEMRLTILSGLASVIRPAAPALRVLSWIALILAVLLISYTGVLLSATNQPLWGGILLLPALFVASAITTGMALILLVLRTGFGRLLDILFGGEGEPVGREALGIMERATLVLIIIQLVVLAGFISWLVFLSKPAAAAAVAVLLTGPMSFVFWGGVVLVGMLIPLALEVASMKARGEALAGSILASTSLVLVGGLFLRVAVLLSGQMT